VDEKGWRVGEDMGWERRVRKCWVLEMEKRAWVLGIGDTGGEKQGKLKTRHESKEKNKRVGRSRGEAGKRDYIASSG